MRNIYVDSTRGTNGTIFTICYDEHITTFQGCLHELQLFIKQLATQDDVIYVDSRGLGTGSYQALKELGLTVLASKRHKVDFVDVKQKVCVIGE